MCVCVCLSACRSGPSVRPSIHPSIHLSKLLLTNFMVKTFDGTNLERVATYKYLGICLDDMLTFSTHIEILKNKNSDQGCHFCVKCTSNPAGLKIGKTILYLPDATQK